MTDGRWIDNDVPWSNPDISGGRGHCCLTYPAEYVSCYVSGMVTEPYSHLPRHEFENLEEAVSTAAVSVYIGPVYCASVYKRLETKC